MPIKSAINARRFDEKIIIEGKNNRKALNGFFYVFFLQYQEYNLCKEYIKYR